MLEVVVNQRRHKISLTGLDISIPLDYKKRQPNCFGMTMATITTARSDRFLGDIKAGGSCNVETVSITPHCNGTHTECVGHLTREELAVPELIKEAGYIAWLATIPADGAILSHDLERPLQCAYDHGATSLILRTLPNCVSKLTRDYDRFPAPWLSRAAAELIAHRRIDHLLVDFPSLDRSNDAALAAHRAFFGLPNDSQELRQASRRHATVTELIYVVDEIPDGLYWLQLQVPRWALEAVPSRPLLFSMELYE